MLNKAIHGIVQMRRCWSNKFCDDMTAIGLELSKSNPCVFHKVVGGEVEMVVVIHVENIFAHAKDQEMRERFTVELGRKFKLKDMCNTKYYMGCHITRDEKAPELKLGQHLYVKSMVEKFDVEKASRIPALQPSEEVEDMSKFPYREAVGALMWTATTTWRDIAYYMIRTVKSFCKTPELVHKTTVLKLNLLHTKEWGIRYREQCCGLNMKT